MTDIEKVSPFEVGQDIRVMPSVTQPRLGWSNETLATVGKIVRIDMDGALNVSLLLSWSCFLDKGGKSFAHVSNMIYTRPVNLLTNIIKT